jgi:antitoxin VapB
MGPLPLITGLQPQYMPAADDRGIAIPSGSCGHGYAALSLSAEKFCQGVPAVPLNIKDAATENFVRELAALTGGTVTTAVRRAAEERLQRVRRNRGGRSLTAEILEIGKR